jgi:hypothetical protein
MGWLTKNKLSDEKRQQLIDDARPALLPDEQIIDVTTGYFESNTRATLAVTDRRVFLLNKRLGDTT